MNLLFIQGGSRLKLSDKGLWYTDPNFTPEVWQRYLSFCDQLIIVLRREKAVYKDNIAQEMFNVIPQTPHIKIVPLEDLMRPIMNFFNPFMRRRVKKVIFDSVKSADKVIIRSTSEYTYYCYQACKRLHKEYMFEVTGFAYEGLYYQSLRGKIVARRNENRQKQLAWDSACALYVTNEALQKRYPSRGRMLGCSDVTIVDDDTNILTNRLNHIKSQRGRIIIGTCGRVADKNKGLHLVVKALALLRKEGITGYEYQLVGFGDQKPLTKIAAKYNLLDSLTFIGGLPHSEINNWLDSIDIYIQPSYSEGLSRAIIEAMSRALPIICSNVGGNTELIDKAFLFNRGDYVTLCSHIIKIRDVMALQAIRNFSLSSNFRKKKLDSQRNDFLRDFILKSEDEYQK